MLTASIIMPCFNHGHFVEDSVRSILGQTHADLELIIVDDCSSDDSWKVIESLAEEDNRIKLMRHERNSGASRSRNDGLRAARGEFIGFCDADDLWEPSKLEVQLDLLRKNLGYDVVYGNAAIVDESGSETGRRFSEIYPLPARASGWLFPELVRRNFINIQTVLMRRECVARCGYFDEGIKWIEDWWYWVRLSRHCRFLYSSQLVAKYRIHSGSTNQVQRRGGCVNRFKVFKRMLHQFKDLPRPTRAFAVFSMAVELQNIGRSQAARNFLWAAVRMSLTDPRSGLILLKALRRIVSPSSLNLVQEPLQDQAGAAAWTV